MQEPHKPFQTFTLAPTESHIFDFGQKGVEKTYGLYYKHSSFNVLKIKQEHTIREACIPKERLVLTGSLIYRMQRISVFALSLMATHTYLFGLD